MTKRPNRLVAAAMAGRALPGHSDSLARLYERYGRPQKDIDELRAGLRKDWEKLNAPALTVDELLAILTQCPDNPSANSASAIYNGGKRVILDGHYDIEKMVRLINERFGR